MRVRQTIFVGVLLLQACGNGSQRETEHAAEEHGASAKTRPQGASAADHVANCAGITSDDAAAILAVAPGTLSVRSRDETPKLRLCSYAQRAEPFASAAFFIAAHESAERAAKRMASEREQMHASSSAISRATGSVGGESAALDLNAVGHDAFWSPLNGALMMRIERYVVQITQPEDRERQRQLALRIAAKLQGENPAAATGSTQGVAIPLIEGMTVVTAIHIDGVCDCESVKQITAVDADAVHLSYAADIPANGIENLFGSSPNHKDARAVAQVRGKRAVLRQDLLTARSYMHLFGAGMPTQIPGSTALGVSALALEELKQRGETKLRMPESGLGAGLAGLVSQLGGQEFEGVQEIGELAHVSNATGILRRVAQASVPFRVLVNGEAHVLPAVHARGRLGDLDGEFYILDDPANPLALQWTWGEDFLQVVKIEFPVTPPDSAKQAGSTLACTLARGDRRAEIHGIHFDFASAVIRPQSQSVLQDIAAALHAYPEWSVRIEGHTDNIGDDAYNAQLSLERASAVRQSLIDQHSISALRLAAQGFGATRPKASNDSLDGRARNRRVELVRTDTTGAASSCASA